jgi:hypothetical protein
MESSLHKHLHEHLNAEIILGIILFKQIHILDLRLVPNSDILNFCPFIHNCEIHTIDESFGKIATIGRPY